jgi:hypothetical protein
MSRSHFRPAAPTDSLPAPRAADGGATVRTAFSTAPPAPEALTTLARLLGRQAAAEMWAAALNQSTGKKT